MTRAGASCVNPPPPIPRNTPVRPTHHFPFSPSFLTQYIANWICRSTSVLRSTVVPPLTTREAVWYINLVHVYNFGGLCLYVGYKALCLSVEDNFRKPWRSKFIIICTSGVSPGIRVKFVFQAHRVNVITGAVTIACSTVAVLGFTFGGSGVAIIAAGGGTDLYCHSEPPLTGGKQVVNYALS